MDGGSVDKLPPRLLRADQVKAYLGDLSTTSLWRWVKCGRIPAPLRGTTLWDKKDLDRAIDRLSGITDKGEDHDTFERRRAAWDQGREAKAG